MATPIKTVRDELAEISRRMRDVVDLATQEGRDLTAEEQQEVTALDRRGRLLQAKLPQAESLPSLLQHVRTSPDAAPIAARGDSIGESFVRSGQFQAVSANLPSSQPWRTSPIDVPWRPQAATLLSPTPGWREGVVAPTPAVPTIARPASLFRQATASAGTVSFLRDPGQPRTAAPVTEGTAKPEMALTLPQVDLPIATIAVWACASAQTVEDVTGFAQWINGVFALDVYDALDQQVLNGTGVAPQMLGVRNHSGLAGPITFTAPETAPDAIARGIAAVYAASRLSPDAIVVDPAAYVAMLSLKASTSGTYLSGAPMSAAPVSLLWGVPVIPSPAMPAGEALVGAFSRAGSLFMRQALRLSLSTEHADYFVKNLVAILGELRGVLAVERPAGFCKVTGLPVPA